MTLAVIVLLALHAGLAFVSARQKSPTFDEVAHLTGGVSYWRFNDYRLQPENGNLPQRLLALPVAFADFTFPDNPQAWEQSDVWTLGRDFFFRTGNDLDRLLLRGRSVAILLSVTTCLVTFFWARALAGPYAGLLALTLCACSPTMLAHGRLMTSDMCFTLFFILSTWAIWECLHRIDIPRVLACSLAVAGLFLSKTSAIAILPTTLLLIVLRLWWRKPLALHLPGRTTTELTNRWQQFVAACGVGLVCTLVSLGAMWLAYGGRYAAASQAPQQFYKFETLDRVTEHLDSPVGDLLGWIGEHRLLPEAYLYGTAFVGAHRRRRAFFFGAYSRDGWMSYLPTTVLLKTPIPTLLLGSAAIVLIGFGLWRLCSRREATPEIERSTPGVATVDHSALLYKLLPILTALAVVWGTSVSAMLCIGHRHVLVTYPLMFVLCGSLLALVGSRAGRTVILLLVVGSAVECFRASPHYLAYFNGIVTRSQAHRVLVDSNLDWGQDLPGLAKWLRQHARDPAVREGRVFLSYFGTSDPRSYGIESVNIPTDYATGPFLPSVRGGVFCISATNLANVYGRFPGEWNSNYEQLYAATQSKLMQIHQSEDGETFNERLLRQDPEAIQLIETNELLAGSRLIAFLRHRQPVDRIGYSILIYHLTDRDVHTALFGRPPESGQQAFSE